MPDLVSIHNLDFAYRQQLVLKHIGLTVEAGSTLGVIGPNGGGKTTLAKLVTGQLRPTRGAITIDGLDVPQAIRRGDIVGYVPQNPAAPADFPIDVWQTVELGLAGKTGVFRKHRKDDLAFVDAIVERVGIAEIKHQPIGQLSGGQLQRVYIARALVTRPKLLVLDEPTTGIDRMGQQRFIEFLQDLKRDLGLTVIFVSHDLRAISAISDRIACLNVTLHYHDVPEHLPADLVYRMFACDLEAVGIGSHGHQCSHGLTATTERTNDQIRMTNE